MRYLSLLHEDRKKRDLGRDELLHCPRREPEKRDEEDWDWCINMAVFAPRIWTFQALTTEHLGLFIFPRACKLSWSEVSLR